MYKRDRALKQQKKALIRANGFKLETMPQIVSPVQNEYGLSSTIHSIHAMSKTLPPNPAALTPIDYERSPYGTPSLGMTVPSHAPLAGYHYSSFPNRTIKSEYPDHYTNAHESMPAYVYPETYPSSSPPDIPEVILKLLQLEPDEAQVKARILACLQQEQGKGRHDKLSTFGLMCKMADQTLFSIVEWARSCIFFKELEVGSWAGGRVTAQRGQCEADRTGGERCEDGVLPWAGLGLKRCEDRSVPVGMNLWSPALQFCWRVPVLFPAPEAAGLEAPGPGCNAGAIPAVATGLMVSDSSRLRQV